MPPFVYMIHKLIWGGVIFTMLFFIGLYFSVHSRFFQLRKFGAIFKAYFHLKREEESDVGVHPIKLFFAAIGACIGIGNVIAIVSAVTIGGPGALFWTWLGAFVGMAIQYSEVYLGLKYRVKSAQGKFEGGPMYYLPIAYKKAWMAPLICLTMCAVAPNFYIFTAMTESLFLSTHLNKYGIAIALIFAVYLIVRGGLSQVGKVCSYIIPLFVISYIVMSCWVIGQHLSSLPSILHAIIAGAFQPQAALGGFAGSTLLLTISMGISRGVYSGDIACGATSVIYSESSTNNIQKQSSLTIIGLFLDTFIICTLSILVVLLTDVWQTDISVSMMVQEAFGLHFPYMYIFMPIFIFLLGFSSLIPYVAVGAKAARFLLPKSGLSFFYTYTFIGYIACTFFDPIEVYTVTSLIAGTKMIINVIGIFLLRKEVHFGLDD